MDPERPLPEPSAHTAEATEVSRAGHVIGSDPTPVPLELGVMVAGRYRLGARLGQGGSGDVHEALDLELGTQVALKLLRPGVATDATIARLRQELLLARKVSHPAVCRVFDLGRHQTAHGTIWFLTMELLRGESLRARIDRDGRLDDTAVRALVGPLTAGLEAAHAVGVIHRDLSPANILLVPDGDGERAVITDFGLAIETEAVLDPLATAGTPGYMAPEQVEGKPATPATDVFALGVVLFHALTGQVPWRGHTASETARLRLTVPAPRPRTVRPELAAMWDEVLGRCLAVEPGHRFGHPAEVARALQPRARARWRWLAAASVLAIIAAAATVSASMRSTRDAPDEPVQSWPAVPPDLAGPVTSAISLGVPSSMVEGAVELADGDLVVSGQALDLQKIRGTRTHHWSDDDCGKRCGFIARISARGEVRWVRIVIEGPDVRSHAPVLSGQLVIVTGDMIDDAEDKSRRDPKARARVKASEPTGNYVTAFSVDDGAVRWVRRFGTTTSRARAIAVDAEGGIYVAGDIARPVSWKDGWQDLPGRPEHSATGYVMAFDPDGNTRWATTIEGLDPVRVHAVTVAGDMVVAGGGTHDQVNDEAGHPLGFEGGVLIGVDRRTGRRRWTQSLGANTHPIAATTASDGSVVVTGWFADTLRFGKFTRVSRGAGDGWVARLDARDGAPAWVTQIGGDHGDKLLGVAATDTAVWAGGSTLGFVDGALVAESHGSGAALLVELSLDGEPRTAQTFGGGDFTSSRARGVARSQRGGVWITGTFTRELVAGNFKLTTDSQNDSFALEIPASRR